MEVGALMFPNPTGSADMARLIEGLGLQSLVFADTQCLTPEVWGQLMLAASAIACGFESSIAPSHVLVIDEAYALHSTTGINYGREAIDTLVSKVHNAPGEDIAVIMCALGSISQNFGNNVMSLGHRKKAEVHVRNESKRQMSISMDEKSEESLAPMMEDGKREAFVLLAGRAVFVVGAQLTVEHWDEIYATYSLVVLGTVVVSCHKLLL